MTSFAMPALLLSAGVLSAQSPAPASAPAPDGQVSNQGGLCLVTLPHGARLTIQLNQMIYEPRSKAMVMLKDGKADLVIQATAADVVDARALAAAYRPRCDRAPSDEALQPAF